MSKSFSGFLGVFLGVCTVGIASSAQASTITFTLNCTANALATCGAPSGPFGSVVLTDNGDWIDIAVSLTSPSGRNITRLLLNYNGLPLPSGYGFTAAGATVSASLPDVQGAGTYGMAFDVNTTVSPAVNPFTTVLKLQKASSPDINLNVSAFDIRDANNLLYAFVNYSGVGPPVGALTSDHGVPVPEPATLSLLALGVSVLTARRVGGRRSRSSA